MVVETLRRYVARLSPEHAGWLSGLRDRAVGKCLALMHEKPAHPWTVDSLAREVGASRSVLAERFTHFVGQSPMQYLGRWRMALATNYLRRSSLNVASIAEEVGYETDAAFSRAFRREFGRAAGHLAAVARRPTSGFHGAPVDCAAAAQARRRTIRATRPRKRSSPIRRTVARATTAGSASTRRGSTRDGPRQWLGRTIGVGHGLQHGAGSLHSGAAVRARPRW